MPRYLVQRTFAGGLALLANEAGAETCRRVVELNAELGVTWLHSYVTTGRERSFCVYDGPDAEAIRLAAKGNGLPIGHTSEVSVLSPYFFL
jgi:Protein of unknown function (DUF4242)